MRRTGLLVLLLGIGPVRAEPAGAVALPDWLELNPRLCLQQAGEPCRISVAMRWPGPDVQELCLEQVDAERARAPQCWQPAPVIRLTLDIDNRTRLRWRAEPGARELAELPVDYLVATRRTRHRNPWNLFQ